MPSITVSIETLARMVEVYVGRAKSSKSTRIERNLEGMKSTATVLLVLTGISGLFLIGKFTQRFSNRTLFIQQMIYQLMTLTMALTLLVINRWIHDDYRSALNVGYFQAPTENFGWMGIKNGTLWNEAVITFLVFPLIITTVVVYFQVLRDAKVTVKRILAALPAAVRSVTPAR